MSFENDDLLLVNRSGTSFKTEYGLLKESIIAGAGGAIVSETEPTGNHHEGDFWYQPSTDNLFVWVVSDTTGVVTSVTVRNGGSGYTSNVTNVATIGGDGEGLTLDIQAGVGGNYASPTVNQGGSGYAVGNVVFLTGAGNQNGSATVTAVNTVATGAWEPAGSGDGASVSVGDTAPANPEQGDLWYDTDSGRLFVWYEDGNTNQWVDASPSGGGDGGGTTIEYSGASAWGSVDEDGTLLAGLNVTTKRINGTSDYVVTFNSPMPNDNYSVQADINSKDGRGGQAFIDTITANSFVVNLRETDGSLLSTGLPFGFAVHSSNALPPRGGTGADAWGKVTLSDNPTIDAGFNINTITYVQEGFWDVTFTNPLPTTDYAVVFGNENTWRCLYNNLERTGFRIQGYNESSGPQNILDTSFVVHATNAQLPDTVTQEQLDAVLDNWTRTGTTLSPTNEGDVVNLTRPAGQNSAALTIGEGGTTFFRIKSQGQVQLGGNDVATSPNIQLSEDGGAEFAGGNIEFFASGISDFYRPITGANVIASWFSDDGGARTRKIRFEADGRVYAANVTFGLTPEQQTTYGIQELDVKEKVLNFITRINQLEALGVNTANRLGAIESNEIIDDATDTSLLQLLANASSRLDSIEARLTALEGN